MRILVRTPNWLGDLVMSLGFFRALVEVHPRADLHLIVKDSLAELAQEFPGRPTVHPFSKRSAPGLAGAMAFGKSLAKQGPFDLFFCLPDSFSAAFMGAFTSSRIRVGFRGQMRSLLLTLALAKPRGLHRVEEYAALLARQSGRDAGTLSTRLEVPREWTKGAPALPVGKRRVVLNVNSEAPSRRMSLDKWVTIGRELVRRLDCRLLLSGGPNETPVTEQLADRLKVGDRVADLAGKTTLPQLASVLRSADLVISTDSGPAHLANAVGTPTIVIFGAGDDRNTAPYMKDNLTVLRVPGLECAPCVSNVCRLGDQRCLERLETGAIIEAAVKAVG